jgi:2-amino-4-hydroxy-6-hydroxymethyldihydropteridine diphosphokinase
VPRRLRVPNRVFVALGSNIEPERNIREAIRLLASRCRLIAVSPVYQTKPVGKTDQPDFVNAAALIETELGPLDLKAQVLQEIERTLGRVRSADKNAPRTIDLDITLFNDQVLDIGHRHIPDPDLLLHPHVAVPISDLEPGYVHPETGQTLQEIAAGMSSFGLFPRPDIELWPARSLRLTTTGHHL